MEGRKERGRLLDMPSWDSILPFFLTAWGRVILTGGLRASPGWPWPGG